MRKIAYLLLSVLFASCGRNVTVGNERIITVSIAPFRYFVESVGGGDFSVNVMVPAGANPHIYEPFPKQIFALRQSVAYISNGYLGFEVTWLDRFYDTNRSMKKLSLGDNIELLGSQHHHDGEHAETADPHYWVSPKCALIMAASVRDFLKELNPPRTAYYNENYLKLVREIENLDKYASDLLKEYPGGSFMIFHPNLAYLARDYGLKEICVEYEGKEPPPSRMRELIDYARMANIRSIFVQKEYDTKNARAIADEIGASIKIIDPLSENWFDSTREMITALHLSLKESSN